MEDYEEKAKGIKEKPRLFDFFQETACFCGSVKVLVASYKQPAKKSFHLSCLTPPLGPYLL